jgi:hypothetical protein
MNLYEKLQACRVKLAGMQIKKSGTNAFAKYDYFELSDYLPHVQALFAEHKLFGHVTFTAEMATLTIINSEKPDETVSFTSPMAEASLKGCHPIQNLGAVQTYQRRYLYQTALEIVEHDALDASTGQPDGKPEPSSRQAQQPPPPVAVADATDGQPWQMSMAQRRRLFAIATGSGIDEDGVRSLVRTVSGQESTAKLTRDQYETVCDLLASHGMPEGPQVAASGQ